MKMKHFSIKILRSFGASDPFLHPEVHLEFFVQSKIVPSCPRDLILAFFLFIFLSSHKNMFISNPETGVSLASWEYNFTLAAYLLHEVSEKNYVTFGNVL